MTEYLRKLPKETLEVVYLARDVAARLNMPAYLVGGFVRDLILGKDNFDLDIVVEGEGIRFACACAQEFKAKFTRHSRFGTATIHLRPPLKIDISTARKEYYPASAELPQVKPGMLKDDLFRRDFTINAMAISISPAYFGKLLDLFGGKRDLSRGLIRILHEKSFLDDPTRILRAVRFEQRFDFRIEPQTLKKLKEATEAKLLEKVQPQRIRDDLILILKEPKPIKEIRRLKELTGFSFISPHLFVSAKTLDFLRVLEKEIQWFKAQHPGRRHLDSWLVYLMGLMDNLDTKKMINLCRTMALRKGEEKRLVNIKEIPSRFIAELSRKGLKPSQVYGLLEPLSYEVIVFIKSKYKNKNLHNHINTFFRLYNGTKISLSGDDLLRLGVMPGPDYRDIFQEVLHAKLDGLVKNKSDEEAFVRKILR